MEQVRVAILGSEYILSTKEDREQTEKVAFFVNQYCEEIKSRLTSPSKLNIVTLAALHIANDYLKMKRDYKGLVSRIEGKSQELDKVLRIS